MSSRRSCRGFDLDNKPLQQTKCTCIADLKNGTVTLVEQQSMLAEHLHSFAVLDWKFVWGGNKLTWFVASVAGCRCHGQSLQSFVVVDLMMNQIDEFSGCDTDLSRLRNSRGNYRGYRQGVSGVVPIGPC